MIGMDLKFDTITSTHNKQIKELIHLKDRRYRKRTGLFLIEGNREVSLAIEANIHLKALYCCPRFFKKGETPPLLHHAFKNKVPVFSLPPPLFEKISYREKPDGILCIAYQFNKKLDDINLGDKPLILVVESLEKPGNLGAIMRSSEAAGVSALIVCDPVTDIFNPNVVRASQGTLFTTQIVASSSEETIKWLQTQKISILATSSQAALEYYEADYRGATAIVAGCEHSGLSPTWIGTADHLVKIPMMGKAHSLNVATAATVILYEAIRQRKTK